VGRGPCAVGVVSFDAPKAAPAPRAGAGP